MSKADRQLLTDLTVLHGFLSDREGFADHFAESVAIAAKRLFPKETLSQGMVSTLAKISEEK